MDPETLEYLQKDFPGYYDRLITLDCGEGWLAIIHDLSNGIKDHLEKCAEEHSSDEPFQVAQVKEKYGVLRYYAEGNTCRHIQDLIEDAETKSRTTCEACGDKAILRRRNQWAYTRCDNCWNKLLTELI